MKRFLDAYYRLLCLALTAVMGLMLVPITLQILSRFLPFLPRYVWTEEAARFCFVWMVMLGAMIAVRDRAHFEVDVLPTPKTPRARLVAALVVHASMLIMAAAFIWYGWGFASFGFRQSSEMSGINLATIYIAFPLAGVTWFVFLFEQVVLAVRQYRLSSAEGTT